MDNADSEVNTTSETADEIKDSSNFNRENQFIESSENQNADVQPEVRQTNDKFTEVVADFTRQLKEINRISQERELIIDRLHKENQQLKQGEFQQALLPIFRDLIKFYDDLGLTFYNYSNDLELNNDKVFRDFSCYHETVNDILYRYGVEQIETKIGDSFNSKEHKAMATVMTDLEEQDRKVAKIIRSGFKTENKIVRNVEVEIYRYEAPSVKKNEEQSKEQTENEIEAIENKSEDK